MIEQVYRFSRADEFRGKIVFLENYDIDMARYLVSGVDLWLNNPIRPHEASGTSGQKASLNGQPNCSILDGWWAEGYNGKNGWAIGEEREFHNENIQDEADSLSLYQLLEEEIVPTYYDQGPDSIPHRWVAVMKEAIRTCAPTFSMRRMVKEYTTRYYVPEIQQGMLIEKNRYEQARVLAAWKNRVNETTNDHVVPQHMLPMKYTKQEADGSYRYDASLQPGHSGSIAYGVRVLPSHPELAGKHDMGLIRWG